VPRERIAVVPAAGHSQRMGRPKLILQVGGQTVIARVVSALRAVLWQLRRRDPVDPSLDAQTLGSFLRRHGQNDATIGALWSIIATATLNLHPDEASLALAAKVFRTGLLDRAAAGRRRVRRCAAG